MKCSFFLFAFHVAIKHFIYSDFFSGSNELRACSTCLCISFMNTHYVRYFTIFGIKILYIKWRAECWVWAVFSCEVKSVCEMVAIKWSERAKEQQEKRGRRQRQRTNERQQKKKLHNSRNRPNTHMFWFGAAHKQKRVLTNENGSALTMSTYSSTLVRRVRLQFCFEFYCVSFRLILPIYSFLSYSNRGEWWGPENAESRRLNLNLNLIFSENPFAWCYAMFALDGLLPVSNVPFYFCVLYTRIFGVSLCVWGVVWVCVCLYLCV